MKYLRQQILEALGESAELLADGEYGGEDPVGPEAELTRELMTDWESGVKHLAQKTLPELLKALNCVDKDVTTLPDFNTAFDTNDVAVSPWDKDEWEKIVGTPRVQPLSVRWHQAVGIYKMIENGIAEKPVLLMDDVGVGKTLQATGLITALGRIIDAVELGGKRTVKPWGKGEFIQAI